MDTTLPSKLLAVQHHHIDQGVQGVVDGTGTPEALATALQLLREHLYVEEQVLFPLLVEMGLTMPVFVMKREHGEMWPLIRKLETACATGADATGLREDAWTLLQQLKIHNTKEEQIVYAAADECEPAHPDAPLLRDMAAARMPEDWVCSMAPR
ncbi:MAG TPA: hemerythrin domain-containing protein [Rhodanobacteraceae bacterium]|nr:hemerythrin domain-containing protein [Rhodanobacteraceae bacterium]